MHEQELKVFTRKNAQTSLWMSDLNYFIAQSAKKYLEKCLEIGENVGYSCCGLNSLANVWCSWQSPAKWKEALLIYKTE